MPFVVGKVVECGSVPGKDKLKQLVVDVGTTTLTVVTNAPNIREGTRTVIALIGTELEVHGEAITVRATLVGGVTSEGMVCDSVMLGWAGGAAGVAVQVPESYALGAPAPTSKPRMDGAAAAVADAVPELSVKELKAQEKAARKAANAEKKAARKAAKEAGGGGADDKEEDDEDEEKGEAAAAKTTKS